MDPKLNFDNVERVDQVRKNILNDKSIKFEVRNLSNRGQKVVTSKRIENHSGFVHSIVAPKLD